MLQTILYGKRFFAYYANNIIGGLDAEGKGCVYSFDPVGSYEREHYRSGGSASSLLQPLIDNVLGLKNQQGAVKSDMSKEETIALVKDLYTSAAERDIYTGDAVEMKIIDKDGITVQRFELRK
jgi:20S proteasome subunit beta 6